MRAGPDRVAQDWEGDGRAGQRCERLKKGWQGRAGPDRAVQDREGDGREGQGRAEM